MGLEHPQILVPKASPGTNLPQILRDDCSQHSHLSFSCMQLLTWQYSQNKVLSCEFCGLKLRYIEPGQLILICSQSLHLKFKYLSWDITQLNHNFTYMLYELFYREIRRKETHCQWQCLFLSLFLAKQSSKKSAKITVICHGLGTPGSNWKWTIRYKFPKIFLLC